MSEPRQVKLKVAAALLDYSEATVRRMVRRGVLPHTGRGVLLRIPVDAIEAKIARMQEGEDLWHGAKEETAASAAVEVYSRPRAANGGPPTKTKRGATADTVRLVGRPPKRF